MARSRLRHARTARHDSRYVLICLILGTGCSEDPGLPVESDLPEFVPGFLADRVCQASSDCCEPPMHIPTCDDPRPMIASLAAGLDAALAANLTWDKTPFISSLADCSSVASNGSILPCSGATQFFYGTQPEGATCEAYGHRMSDCQQGLACGADRVCHQACDVPHVAYEDQFCGPERGMWFVSCAPGLACFPDGVCRVGGLLDGGCTQAEPCAVGWCDDWTNTCVADLPADSPCEDHIQCESKYCWEGACYAAPTEELCGRWGW